MGGVQPAGGLFEALLDAAPDAMLVVRTDGRMVLVNGQVERLFGYTRGELVGQSVEMLVPDRFCAAHPMYRAAYLADPHTRPMGGGIDLYGRRKDGSEFPAEISLAPVPSSEGLLVTAAIRDVTSRRRADEMLRDVLEAAPDAMVIVEASGTIRLINVQTEKLFGYRRDELIGNKIETLVPQRYRGHHPELRGRYFAAPRPRDMASGIDLTGVRKDGTEFSAEISLSPMQTPEGTLVTAAIRNVTERRRVEELRRHALEETSRLKSEFLANMSHELRTPLNSIMGFAKLMHHGRVGAISDVQREYLGDILNSANHLLQLINDVLDLSKVEAGHMQFFPVPIDLPQLVGELRDTLRAVAASKRIKLDVDVAADCVGLELDAARVKQVLYNYASNALKFTDEGGSVSIRACTEGEAHIRIEVTDTGVGIRPEDMTKLFLEFRQLDASASKHQQGTGLGLALTKRIVEAQGGRVGVQSTWGVGSTFFAILPKVCLLSAEKRGPEHG